MLDYDEAARLFEKRRSGTKKVGNNTYLWRDGECFVMTLYGRRIASFYRHYVILDNCGWPTLTTKDRLNWCRGVRVYSLDGNWFIDTALHQGPPGRSKLNRAVFYNKMIVDQNSGEILSGVRYMDSKRRIHPPGHQTGVWTPPAWEAGRLERLAPSL